MTFRRAAICIDCTCRVTLEAYDAAPVVLRLLLGCCPRCGGELRRVEVRHRPETKRQRMTPPHHRRSAVRRERRAG
jgi:hypothetical protein